jgi:hypothetical protein
MADFERVDLLMGAEKLSDFINLLLVVNESLYKIALNLEDL